MTNPTKIADNLLSELRRDFEMDDVTEDLVRDAVWLAWGKGQDALRAADAEGESSEPGERERDEEIEYGPGETVVNLYDGARAAGFAEGVECGLSDVEAVMKECSACTRPAVEDGLCDHCRSSPSPRTTPPEAAPRPGWLSERLARAVLDGAADTDAARTFARLILGLPESPPPATPPEAAPERDHGWCSNPSCKGGCGCTQTGVCACPPPSAEKDEEPTTWAKARVLPCGCVDLCLCNGRGGPRDAR